MTIDPEYWTALYVQATFWKRVVQHGDCWEWTGPRNAAGYGEFACKEAWGVNRARRAHVVAYEWLIGPIPEGHPLDHLCRNRACVNPFHLDVVTTRENVLRSPNSPIALNARKNECCHGHPFNELNTWTSSQNGSRHCRVCVRIRQRVRERRRRGVDASFEEELALETRIHLTAV